MVTPNSPLHLSLVAQENMYKLVEDYNVVVKINAQTYDIWVPEGFEYDGASIPFYLWLIFYSPFAPDVMRAALVHDWLYYTHQVQEGLITRKIADSVFKIIMDDDGNSIIKSKLMYWGLRIGGRFFWKNSKSEIKTLKKIRTNKGAEAWKFGL